jgi:hypothetical protein
MNRHLNHEGQEWKTGHAKGRELIEEGREKEKVKKVNMADVFSI